LPLDVFDDDGQVNREEQSVLRKPDGRNHKCMGHEIRATGNLGDHRPGRPVIVTFPDGTEKEFETIRSKTAVFLVIANAIRANWLDGECTVLAPDQFMQSMGSRYRFKAKTSASYVCKPDEAEILMFTKPGHTHFVLGDGNGKIYLDPLTDHDMSPYKLTEKRIYKRLP